MAFQLIEKRKICRYCLKPMGNSGNTELVNGVSIPAHSKCVKKFSNSQENKRKPDYWKNIAKSMNLNCDMGYYAWTINEGTGTGYEFLKDVQKQINDALHGNDKSGESENE